MELVSPLLPTVLGDDEYYNLTDSDLMLQFPVETGFLFEGEIDRKRFLHALERALSAFPLFCGRLRTASDARHPWRIQLLNQPVKVEFIDAPDNDMLPRDSVIQDPWYYSPPLDIDAIRMCKDTALFKMRVINFQTNPRVTTVGATSAHLIGDGSFMTKFWRFISHAYQSLSFPEAVPTYSRHPVDITCLEAWNRTELEEQFPQLLARNPSTQLPNSQRITLFFSPAQLTQLREILSKRLQDTNISDNTIKLSVQDCVTALVTTACSQALAEMKSTIGPVKFISNVLNLRGGILPLDEPLNALSWANATTPSPFDVVQTAVAIRRSFLTAREQTYQAACLLTIRRLWRDAADKGEKVDFTPLANSFLLNSSWRFDHTSAHFGFGQSKTHFLHTVSKFPRYAKMFKRNPPLRFGKEPQPGQERGPGGAEFTFYLLPEDRVAFLKCLREQFKALDMAGEIDVMD
ncbi:hypothetical protein FRC18_000699 [Serendipita sp. 400]|nr:hypothetical protein FRC18_000699 [Serendipita sp. 400]